MEYDAVPPPSGLYSSADSQQQRSGARRIGRAAQPIRRKERRAVGPAQATADPLGPDASLGAATLGSNVEQDRCLLKSHPVSSLESTLDPQVMIPPSGIEVYTRGRMSTRNTSSLASSSSSSKVVAHGAPCLGPSPDVMPLPSSRLLPPPGMRPKGCRKEPAEKKQAVQWRPVSQGQSRSKVQDFSATKPALQDRQEIAVDFGQPVTISGKPMRGGLSGFPPSNQGPNSKIDHGNLPRSSEPSVASFGAQRGSGRQSIVGDGLLAPPTATPAAFSATPENASSSAALSNARKMGPCMGPRQLRNTVGIKTPHPGSLPQPAALQKRPEGEVPTQSVKGSPTCLTQNLPVLKTESRSAEPRVLGGETSMGSHAPMQAGSISHRMKFPEYWDAGRVSQGVKQGQLFRAAFRVNAFKRTEAYVTILGAPVDVLIDGMVAQNRAVEGDTVVVAVNPVSLWTKLRGCKVGEEKGAADGSEEAAAAALECLDLGVTGKGPLQNPTELENKLGSVECEPPLEAGVSSPAPLGVSSGSTEIGNSTEESSCDEDSDPAAAKAVQALAALMRANPTKRPTGSVVAILEFSTRREAIVGYLDIPVGGVNGGWTSPTVQLLPADPRLPRMVVFVDGLPDGLKERVRALDPLLARTLVAARLHNWKATCSLPQAMVRQSLGQAGEIETETAAIVFEHKVQGPDFPDAVLKCLPPTPWSIPEAEIRRRQDLRESRIVSIDPPTARDLDDALSIQLLPSGNVRVGVHIADVSFFVRPGTDLDKEARLRSTSVYLVQKVIPMLPPLLCEELCSLNPGVDRLAFSVVWELTKSGDIIDQWMGRTVIRTCCKLAYGHAQAMIDNAFDPEGATNGATEQGASKPVALHGNHEWRDVIHDVQTLHHIAKEMRARRFAGGALRLDNSKLLFALDEDGNPKDAFSFQAAEANQLVEEFMLLANRSVARAISRALPERALLRRHPPPNARKLEEVAALCEKQGLQMDFASAGAIHESLEQLKRSEHPEICEIIRLAVTKPMQLAQYFCTGGELSGDSAQWEHYGLAMPLYTHFTSPIRRYPDVLVHRILAAALEAEERLQSSRPNQGAFVRPFTGPPSLEEQRGEECEEAVLAGRANQQAREEVVARTAKQHGLPTTDVLVGMASYCNERKTASRQAQEASDRLYLCVLLKQAELMACEARVVNVGPKFITLYVLRFGIERRVYFEDMKGLKAEFFEATDTVIIDEDPNGKGGSAKKKKGVRKSLGNGRSKESASANSGDTGKGALRQDVLLGAGSGDASKVEEEGLGSSEGLEPAVLPLTLKVFSQVPVVCSAFCPPRQPMDVVARLWISKSYEVDS